jgi:hypothetical protein
MEGFDNTVAKFMEFKDKSPKTFKQAYELTKNIETLAKIYENMWLFKKIMKSRCIKYTFLVYALDAMEEASDNYLLIQFTDIDLYCVFEHRHYTSFVEDFDDNASVELYQIVLAGRKQKLVFACTDSNYFDKLQGHAKNCFNTNVEASKNQITIDIVNSCERDITDNYNKLYKYVSRFKDEDCLNAMKEMRTLNESKHEYRKFSIADVIGYEGNFMDLLRSAGHIIINGNVTINQNSGDVNTTNNGVIDKTQLARDWIANNPPNDREVTTDYYARYATSNTITNNIFGKLVRDAGYKTVQGINKRMWVKL